jgi:hypothetical protein
MQIRKEKVAEDGGGWNPSTSLMKLLARIFTDSSSRMHFSALLFSFFFASSFAP